MISYAAVCNVVAAPLARFRRPNLAEVYNAPDVWPVDAPDVAPDEPEAIAETERLEEYEWTIWRAKQRLYAAGTIEGLPRPDLAPEDWSPPSTRILAFEIPRNNFSPVCPRSMPHEWMTFAMPLRPANQLAVMLNTIAMAEGKQENSQWWWACVCRPMKKGGFRVLQVPCSPTWQPTSPLDFPEGVSERHTANLPAQQECLVFNRVVLAGPQTPTLSWAVPVRPLKPIDC